MANVSMSIEISFKGTPDAFIEACKAGGIKVKLKKNKIAVGSFWKGISGTIINIGDDWTGTIIIANNEKYVAKYTAEIKAYLKNFLA